MLSKNMWQSVAIKLLIPKRLTTKIFGSFCCLFFGSTAAVGDGCAPKSTLLGRPEIIKHSFHLVLQSNSTSVVLSFAVAVALVMAGSVLRSWNAVQRWDPTVGSCQKCLLVPLGAVEGKGKV